MTRDVFHNYGPDPDTPLFHATAITAFGRGVLIVGPSGSGKSSLALRLMALGADLVSDDRVLVTRTGKNLCMMRPDAIKNRIEAYGIGVLSISSVPTAPLDFVVDVSKNGEKRLPDVVKASILGQTRPMLRGKELSTLSDAVFLILRHGICDETVTRS